MKNILESVLALRTLFKNMQTYNNIIICLIGGLQNLTFVDNYIPCHITLAAE